MQKNALIFGLANKRSIAWAIAQKLHAAGWRLGITYMNERLGLEAKDLIAELPGASGFMCDLTKDDEIAASLACHAAIKVNMPLEPSKMEWLLDALAKTDCPMSCPHGRPVVLRYSVREIEKAFHRI